MRLSSPETLPGVPRLRGAHPLVHFANAFAPPVPTATYIAGVKTTRARSTGSGGVVGGDQVFPSSLNTTAPPCPTATNREPNTTLLRSEDSGGVIVIGLQVMPSVLVKIVPASPTTTKTAVGAERKVAPRSAVGGVTVWVVQ